tara:strand:+ start:366 stop:1160 length:795 start_codon:yes stop_codon:yes gene_type:complete
MINIYYTFIYGIPLWISCFILSIYTGPLYNLVLNEWLLKIQYYVLKLYTKCENYYIKYRKSLITQDIICIISDGIEIINNKCEQSAIVNEKIIQKKLLYCLTDTSISLLGATPHDFDMIFYKFPSKDAKYDYNIKRIDNIDVFDNNYSTPKFYEGDINIVNSSIIGIQVEIINEYNKKEEYPINLDTDNYFLENNKLFDKKFMKFWLYEKYRILEFKSYKVSYFDKKTMNLETLENGDYITITVNGCKITRIKELTNNSDFLII